MNEDEYERQLHEALLRLTNALLMGGEHTDHYWHFDEDFAAFMDHVLEPVDVD